MEEAYLEWKSLCNMFAPGLAAFSVRAPECTFSYPSAAAPPPPPPIATPPPSGGPASCDQYVDNSVLCAKKVAKFGFFAERDRLDQEQTTALKACAKNICDNWPGGGTVKLVSPPHPPHPTFSRPIRRNPQRPP